MGVVKACGGLCRAVDGVGSRSTFMSRSGISTESALTPLNQACILGNSTIVSILLGLDATARPTAGVGMSFCYVASQWQSELLNLNFWPAIAKFAGQRNEG